MSDPSVDPQQPGPPDDGPAEDPPPPRPAPAYRRAAGATEIAAAMARATSVSRRFGAVRYALVGLDADASVTDGQRAAETGTGVAPAAGCDDDQYRHPGRHRGRDRDPEPQPWSDRDPGPDGPAGTDPGGTP